MPDQRSQISRQNTSSSATKVPDQSAGPFSESIYISGEHEGQSTMQTPLYCAEAGQQCQCSRTEEPDPQVPCKQFRQEEVPGQSAGSLSDAGEHEGQSTVQTPLVSYTAQRLASSADAPD